MTWIANARKDASLLKSKLDELESKHTDELASASARINVLEQEKKKLKGELENATSLAVRLDESRARRAT